MTSSVSEGGSPIGPDESGDRREDILRSLARLYDLTATLRRECPWDRAQTQQDIVAYTLEETYELIDAVRGTSLPDRAHAAGDPDAGTGHDLVRGELGDLLFQVYFLAYVAEEGGWYDLGDVADGIHTKLVRRHPHIFGDVEADTPDDVRRTWDDIKRHTEGRQGIFHEVPKALSSALFAQKVQQRAAAVGFDWREAVDVVEKIREEVSDLEQAMLQSRADEIEAEVGDLLFAAINLSRKLKMDPELALRAATHRFQARVETAAGLAERQGQRFEDMDLDEQETYYQKAKKRLVEDKDVGYGGGTIEDGTQGSV
jgi:MazG family protein